MIGAGKFGPFRAGRIGGALSQGCTLGYHIAPRWGRMHLTCDDQVDAVQLSSVG